MVDRLNPVALMVEKPMRALRDVEYDFSEEQRFRDAAGNASRALQTFWSLVAEREQAGNEATGKRRE
jgi:hypothetical protein